MIITFEIRILEFTRIVNLICRISNFKMRNSNIIIITIHFKIRSFPNGYRSFLLVREHPSSNLPNNHLPIPTSINKYDKCLNRCVNNVIIIYRLHRLNKYYNLFYKDCNNQNKNPEIVSST